MKKHSAIRVFASNLQKLTTAAFQNIRARHAGSIGGIAWTITRDIWLSTCEKIVIVTGIISLRSLSLGATRQTAIRCSQSRLTGVRLKAATLPFELRCT